MEDKATLRELRQRYFADRRWKDLADVLRREIAVTDDREERLDLYEELGTVAVDYLRDVELSFDAFKTVIDLRDSWGEDEALDVYRQLVELEPNFEPAFERLEATLRGRGDIDSLQELAMRYIDRASDSDGQPGEVLRYYGEAARIFELDLGDPDAALMVLNSALGVDTWQLGVLDEIERLARLTGEWGELIDGVKAVTTELGDGPAAARLHKRLGFWLIDVGDYEEAIHHLRVVIRHAPQDDEALDALDQLYRATKRWGEMIETSRAKVANASDPARRRRALDEHIGLLRDALTEPLGERVEARFLAELGTIHERDLNDRLTAVSYWERALNKEPETLEAAQPLIDHYMNENRWERAAPVLEVVVKAAEGKRAVLDPAELNQRYLQYGQVLDMLGNEKLALHAYRQAYEIDRNNPRTLERLSLLLYAAGEHDQAYHAMIALVDRHERSVARPVLIDVLQKAAEIKRKGGDVRTAQGLLERAVRLEPRNTGALRAIAAIGQEAGDFAQVMNARLQLVQAEEDPRLKFKELVEIGDTWVEHDRLDDAAHSYIAALELQEDSVGVLRKLLETFRKKARWGEAIGVLERLVALEGDRRKRATLYYTMGIIARDEIRLGDRAVRYFDLALDENLELLKAFEAIDRILTEARMWKELERAYRRMLHRVAENDLELKKDRLDDLAFLLWTSLGEVYRSRLGSAEAATKAFETAQGLRPEDDNVRMILAELYTLSGANTAGASQQHRRMLEKDPRRTESYRALYDAYMNERQFDRAWCVASVITHLGAPTEDEREFYQRYLGWNLKLCQGHFAPELLDRVYPSTQNRVVNAVLAHLGVGLRPFFAHPIKDFGVDPKRDGLEAADAKLVVAKMYAYVAKTLSITPPPHVYLRRDHPLGIRILNTDPPAVLLGADMLHNITDDRQLAFRLGKILGWMRPEHYLAAIGNTPGQLTVIFLTAMDWALGRKASAGKDGAALLKQIKGLPSQTQLQLQSLMRVYLERTQQPPDMGQWITSAEMTTSRLGLILCQDLEKAIQALRTEPPAMTAATTRERIDDLLAFASSEVYSDLRKELGLAIG